LIAAYKIHVESYYRKPEGTPTSEINNIRSALKPLRVLYGATPAAAFSPLALTVLWARSYSYMNMIAVDHASIINARSTRILRLQLWFESGHSIFSSTTIVESGDPPLRLPIGIGWGFVPYDEFGPVTSGHD
jgi:hypothetical protein